MMKQFAKYLVMSIGLASAVMTVTETARADETSTPQVVTLKPQTVVGNPRRPVVVIEITRERPNVPLHELTRVTPPARTSPL